MLKLVAFSGGRGSETFVKYWNSSRICSLDLIINPYDDGLSTGRLRDFVKGYLGPSDFRKNLVHYLGSSNSFQNSAWSRLLDFRINSKIELVEFCRQELDKSGISSGDAFVTLAKNALLSFYNYEIEKGELFDYRDCAVGNLILAGLYVTEKNDFQKSIDALCASLNVDLGIYSATNESSTALIAITDQGEFLGREYLIVNGLYRGSVSKLGFVKTDFLLSKHAPTSGVISEEQIKVIEKNLILPAPNVVVGSKLTEADIICYLPGTQNSSLFPSYLVLNKELETAKAKVKVLVLNLTRDLDMGNWSRSEIVTNALKHMGDPENANLSITHVFLNEPALDASLLNGEIENICSRLGIRLVKKNFSLSENPAVHSGEALLRNIIELK